MPDSWRSSPDVLVTDLDNELVLLDPTTRAMFTLNATGRFVWQRLEVPTSADRIAEEMAVTFAVDRETAARDIAELLTQLASSGLIHAV